MQKSEFLVVIGTALLCTTLIAGAQAPPAGRTQQALPEGNGKAIVETACSKCHGLNMITGSWGNTREGWQELVNSMVVLPKDQSDAVFTYLATHFPPKPGP